MGKFRRSQSSIDGHIAASSGWWTRSAAQTLDRQKLSVHGIHMRMTVEQTAVRVLADGNNRASGNAACVVVPVGSGNLQH